jgi:ATP-dependent Clp protease adaptor protein ClpS
MAAMAKLGQHGTLDAMAEDAVASDAAVSRAAARLEASRLPRPRTGDRLGGSVLSRPLGMAERRKGTPGDGSGTALLTKTRTRTKRPNMYRVLLLNDDYTPMEFVVHVLEQFFNKSREEATRIMLHVHQNGVGECGVFTYEVAETKVTQVMDFARKHQHPLQCVMEKK